MIRGVPFAQQLEERLVLKSFWVWYTTLVCAGENETLMSQGDVCGRQRELWSVFVSGDVHYRCCLVQDLNQHRILRCDIPVVLVKSQNYTAHT